MFKFLTKWRYDRDMNGEQTKGIEDIVRRNVAALRSKANLTQQALADEMLLRGIAWTRETVAQVETTNRRLGFTEAIVVAACLDVPVARLTATGAPTVAVGESEWTAAYLGAAIAGTTGDIFPAESYASPAATRVGPAAAAAPSTAPPPASPVPGEPAASLVDLLESPSRSAPPGEVPERRRGERRASDPEAREVPGRRSTDGRGGDAAEDGRADRTPAPAAGDGRRRRRHRPAPLVAQPRGRAGATGHRPRGPDRWFAQDHPRPCLSRPRPGDRLRDGAGSRTGRGTGGAARAR